MLKASNHHSEKQHVGVSSTIPHPPSSPSPTSPFHRCHEGLSYDIFMGLLCKNADHKQKVYISRHIFAYKENIHCNKMF